MNWWVASAETLDAGSVFGNTKTTYFSMVDYMGGNRGTHGLDTNYGNAASNLGELVY